MKLLRRHPRSTFSSIPTMLASCKTFPTWRQRRAKSGLGLKFFRRRDKAQALMIANDAFFTARASQIAALAARYSLPAVYPWREQAEAGGLISYGTSIREAFRQSGIYVGQILKGAKAAVALAHGTGGSLATRHGSATLIMGRE